MARTFRQKKHRRISKKGKVFTAGQKVAIGVVGVAANVWAVHGLGKEIISRDIATQFKREKVSLIGPTQLRANREINVARLKGVFRKLSRTKVRKW